MHHVCQNEKSLLSLPMPREGTPQRPRPPEAENKKMTPRSDFPSPRTRQHTMFPQGPLWPGTAPSLLRRKALSLKEKPVRIWTPTPARDMLPPYGSVRGRPSTESSRRSGAARRASLRRESLQNVFSGITVLSAKRFPPKRESADSEGVFLSNRKREYRALFQKRRPSPPGGP